MHSLTWMALPQPVCKNATLSLAFRVMSQSLNVDRHERLIAYDPCVVSWWEQRNVARLKVHFASVIHDDMEAS